MNTTITDTSGHQHDCEVWHPMPIPNAVLDMPELDIRYNHPGGDRPSTHWLVRPPLPPMPEAPRAMTQEDKDEAWISEVIERLMDRNTSFVADIHEGMRLAMAYERARQSTQPGGKP